MTNNLYFKLPFSLFTICWLFYPLSAASKEIDLIPLNLYLSGDPYILGAGGFDTERDICYPEIYRPAALLNQGGYISLQYKSENVLNLKEDNWKKASIGSAGKEVSGLLPFDSPLFKKGAFAFSSKDFESTADVSDNNQDLSLRSSQHYKVNTITVSSSPISSIRGGIGWEDYSDRSNLFYEAVFAPADEVSIGYRRFHREMHIENSLSKSGYMAKFYLSPSEDVKEITFNITAPKKFRLSMAVEDNNPGNINISLNIYPSNSLSVDYHKWRRELNFFNEITINGISSGHISGVIDYSTDILNIEIPLPKRRYLLGIKESTFKIFGAGRVKGDYILNFWENLLAGNRFFNYNISIRSTQYHLGIEDKTTERLTLRGGIQYIITTPEGNLDHWTPFPLIKIGKLDEEILMPPYTKATLGALTFGISYKIYNIELSYAIGQIIPIKIEEREKPPTEIRVEELDTGELQDRIKENPGGNIQSLRMTWYF